MCWFKTKKKKKAPILERNPDETTISVPINDRTSFQSACSSQSGKARVRSWSQVLTGDLAEDCGLSHTMSG